MVIWDHSCRCFPSLSPEYHLYFARRPDSKMIGKTRSDGLDDLTLKEVRQAFAAAQTEPLFGDDGHEHDIKLTNRAAADEETKSTNTGTAANHLSHLQVGLTGALASPSVASFRRS